MKHLYLILSIFIFFLTPEEYNIKFCIICATLFVLQAINTIAYDTKKFGILNFNFLFLLSAFIILYIYPIFVHKNIDYSILLRYLIFNDNTINIVTSLSTLAFSIYCWAYLSSGENTPRLNYSVGIKNGVTHTLNILSILSVIAFTANVLFFVRTMSNEFSDLTTNAYVSDIAKVIIIANLVIGSFKNSTQIANNKIAFYTQNKIAIICLVILILEYLYIGDRGFVIVGAITLLFTYNFFVSKIRLPIILLMFSVGAVFMFLVGQLRKTDASFRTGGTEAFISGSMDILESSETDPYGWDYISDLTGVATVGYIGYEYYTKNGIRKPERILGILFSPIPLAPSIINGLLYDDSLEESSTGTMITQYYRSQTGYYGHGGLGTHAVLDLLISWGMIGVIIGFYIFGRVISYFTRYSNNIYHFAILLILIGLAIYIPRSTLYNTIRMIVWLYLLLRLCTYKRYINFTLPKKF